MLAVIPPPKIDLFMFAFDSLHFTIARTTISAIDAELARFTLAFYHELVNTSPDRGSDGVVTPSLIQLLLLPGLLQDKL
jgi:hypothetical protein